MTRQSEPNPGVALKYPASLGQSQVDETYSIRNRLTGEMARFTHPPYGPRVLTTDPSKEAIPLEFESSKEAFELLYLQVNWLPSMNLEHYDVVRVRRESLLSVVAPPERIKVNALHIRTAIDKVALLYGLSPEAARGRFIFTLMLVRSTAEQDLAFFQSNQGKAVYVAGRSPLFAQRLLASVPAPEDYPYDDLKDTIVLVLEDH